MSKYKKEAPIPDNAINVNQFTLEHYLWAITKDVTLFMHDEKIKDSLIHKIRRIWDLVPAKCTEQHCLCLEDHIGNIMCCRCFEKII